MLIGNQKNLQCIHKIWSYNGVGQSQQGKAFRDSSFDESPDNHLHAEQSGLILSSWYQNLGSLGMIKNNHLKCQKCLSVQKASPYQ